MEPAISGPFRNTAEAFPRRFLNARLFELREAGVIELREGEGYAITSEGLKLCEIVGQLDTWARGWARRIDVPVEICKKNR